MLAARRHKSRRNLQTNSPQQVVRYTPSSTMNTNLSKQPVPRQGAQMPCVATLAWAIFTEYRHSGPTLAVPVTHDDHPEVSCATSICLMLGRPAAKPRKFRRNAQFSREGCKCPYPSSHRTRSSFANPPGTCFIDVATGPGPHAHPARPPSAR